MLCSIRLHVVLPQAATQAPREWRRGQGYCEVTMNGKRGPSTGRGAVRPCGRLVPLGGRPVPGRACGGAGMMIRPNVMRKWKTEGLDREQGRDPVTA